MPIAISCVTLPVDDVQRAKSFYTAFGLSVEEQDEDHAAFDLDGVYLVLLSRSAFADYADSAGQSAAAKGSTEAILTYFADTRAEVDQTLQKAEGAGAQITQADEDEGSYSGYFTDPDGHTWEVLYDAS